MHRCPSAAIDVYLYFTFCTWVPLKFSPQRKHTENPQTIMKTKRYLIHVAINRSTFNSRYIFASTCFHSAYSEIIFPNKNIFMGRDSHIR